MGWQQEYVTISGHFLSEWGDLCPVVEENAAFDPPSRSEWIRFQVLGGLAQVASIGGPNTRYRHDGDVVIEVFVPPHAGPGRARELADIASATLRGLLIDGITFWAPRLVRVGPQDGWHRMNLICPFQRDEAFAY